MRNIVLVPLFSITLLMSVVVSYEFGYRHGKRKESDNYTWFELISNVTNYNELSAGQYENVKHNLVILINGDLATLDNRKLGEKVEDKDKVRSIYIEKARTIQKQTKITANAVLNGQNQ